MSWSAEQVRMLRAMGHEPMRLAPAPGERAAAPLAVAEAMQPSRGAVASGVLAAAIARAAGGRDLSGLSLDLDKLRREPALKRALWPRLRALRREH